MVELTGDLRLRVLDGKTRMDELSEGVVAVWCVSGLPDADGLAPRLDLRAVSAVLASYTSSLPVGVAVFQILGQLRHRALSDFAPRSH
jgi:hypothetical protein